jgi:exoribonuclease R
VVRTPKKWPRIVQLAADIGETLPADPDRVALSEFLMRRKIADPEHFPDLSLSVVKLLGPGEYMLERRLDGRAGEGHFGLAVAEYTHSTAPNRRFPDLVTQRMMKATELGGRSPYTEVELVEIAQRCTLREDAARKVERSVRKKAAAVLMRERVGESFPAMVTGASAKGIYVRLLAPPVEGRLVRGGQSLDIGDTVRVKLVRVDAARGYIDFEHESADVDRKLERSRRKKAAAAKLRERIGEMFAATVTAVTPNGTWARTVDGIEGRIMRGHKRLTQGQSVNLRLVGADSVHGFIDFEFPEGIEPKKAERFDRKRSSAVRLQPLIGEMFDAVITGVSQKATYLHTSAPDEVDGRLVRGMTGLGPGDRVKVLLLTADPARGHIDFARAE